jgi:hypothetical protein
MTYRRKVKNQKAEEPENNIELFSEERTLPTIEEVEENIKKVIEIDKMIEKTLEKLDALPNVSQPPAPTGKVFIGEEDKRLFKRFNQHIIKKLGITGNRSFKL